MNNCYQDGMVCPYNEDMASQVKTTPGKARSMSMNRINPSINENPIIQWLLEAENPSVQFFTLTRLLDYSPEHPEVVASRSALTSREPVPQILARQSPTGCWEEPENYYVRRKYTGTVWTMLLLAELGLDGEKEEVRRAAEFMLNKSQDPDSGAFTYRNKDNKPAPNAVIPCLTANMCWCLLRFGYLNDPRLQQAIQWLATYMRFDDGDGKPPSSYPYDRFDNCWGAHTCMMPVVKTLKALAEIPPAERSVPINQTISAAAEFILKHHLYRRSHNPSEIANAAWTNLEFPLMWNTDILEMLIVLLELGYADSRMQEALNLLYSRRSAQGKWVLDHSYNGRFQVRIEKTGRPSKWITFRSLYALKMAAGAGLVPAEPPGSSS